MVAIGTDNKTYTWGSNTLGQLGNGSIGGWSATPSVVLMPDGMSASSASPNTLSAPEASSDADNSSTPGIPAMTDPSSQTVSAGDDAQFQVTATGDPAPSITWEVSTDNGATWKPLTPDASTHISTDGTTLTLAGVTADLDGRQYRATATNNLGSATSTPVTLSVRGGPPTPAALSSPLESTPPDSSGK